MFDAEYFARALWGEDTNPDLARIAKAKLRAVEFGVKWEDVEALRLSPSIRTARPVAPVVLSSSGTQPTSPGSASVAVGRPKRKSGRK
jgi:hypothetical protein